jgi:gamma-glutamylcyclotransferase
VGRSARIAAIGESAAVSTFYFAYGSNLKLARMRERVTSVRVVAPGRLPGFRLGLDKRGLDGSGKANLVRESGDSVWGVVYRIDPTHWEDLDGHEPGYGRHSVSVWTATERLAVQTYVARVFTDDPVAFDWYKRLILEGAQEHGLPAAYLEVLSGLPERPDPGEIS